VPPTRTCFGLVGPLDIDDLDVQLTWRITAHELQRRRADVTLRSFAPFGSARRVPIAADEPIEALLPDSVARRRSLGAELSAVIAIDPGFGLDELARSYDDEPEPDPRDIATAAELLADLPFDAPTGRAPRQPHPALLARRWWPYPVCEQRRELLRAMQWWPQHLPAIVIQGSDQDASIVDLLAAVIPNSPIVALETEPADAVFATALAMRLGPRVHRLPAALTSLEDRIAAVAGAAVVIAASPTVRDLAAGYSRPHQSLLERLEGADPHETRGSAAVEAVLDEHFDVLAGLDGGTARPVSVDAEVAALRAALDAQRRRSARERVVLADYVRALRNITGDQVRDLQAVLERRLPAKVRRRVGRSDG
jgi:hypothetical protein